MGFSEKNPFPKDPFSEPRVPPWTDIGPLMDLPKAQSCHLEADAQNHSNMGERQGIAPKCDRAIKAEKLQLDVG